MEKTTTTHLAQRSRASDKLSVNSSALSTKDAFFPPNMTSFLWMSWAVAEVLAGELIKHKRAIKRNALVISFSTQQSCLYMSRRHVRDVQHVSEDKHMRIEQWIYGAVSDGTTPCLHAFAQQLRQEMREESYCTLIHAVYFPQTVCNLQLTMVGGVYESKGQCKRPTAVLVLDMWMRKKWTGKTSSLKWTTTFLAV